MHQWYNTAAAQINETMYHVFDWQLLSPVFASWWVWTQSQTFQRKNKLQTRSPTADFSPILTSQKSLVLSKSPGRKKIPKNTHTDIKYLNILHMSPPREMSDEELDESSCMVSYDSDPQTWNIWICFRLFSWGGLAAFLSLPNKTRRSFVIFPPPRLK